MLAQAQTQLNLQVGKSYRNVADNVQYDEEYIGEDNVVYTIEKIEGYKVYAFYTYLDDELGTVKVDVVFYLNSVFPAPTKETTTLYKLKRYNPKYKVVKTGSRAFQKEFNSPITAVGFAIDRLLPDPTTEEIKIFVVFPDEQKQIHKDSVKEMLEVGKDVRALNALNITIY